MARLSTVTTGATSRDHTNINLSRLLSRLREQLIDPDEATKKQLTSSSLEREKVAENVEYARTLLVRLEQDASGIKVLGRRQEVQAGLVGKRGQIERFQEVLGELEAVAENSDEEDSSEGEDILGEDTPSETDDQASQADSIHDNAIYDTGDPVPQPSDPDPEPIPITEPEPTSVLRSRFPQPPAATSAMSIATSEALLTHNRTEQEALTTSLLSMAAQLKQQSRAFAASLEDEKGILENTGAVLDRNESGMEAAQRRMRSLTGMTEGRSWWGRMLIYAWIAGLWVIALVIVFVLPKLRF